MDYGAANCTFLCTEKTRNVYGPVIPYGNGRESNLITFKWRALNNRSGIPCILIIVTNMLHITDILNASF
jgi:hypothetical protein